MTYEVRGESIELENLKDVVYIKLYCEHPFDIRIDKILSSKLGASREAIKKLVKKGRIQCDEEKNIEKAKLKRSMIIKINV